MRHMDFSPLFRATVGFDRLMNQLDAAARIDGTAVSYPPYNIEKTGEDSYRITMAVAGFAPDEIDITVRENSLIVTGKKAEGDSGAQFLHRGIAARSFERRFQLADTIKVGGASVENGLLHVELQREIPEAQKPRRITIGAAPSNVRQVADKAAA